MTLAPEKHTSPAAGPASSPASGQAPGRARVGAYPWVMAGAVGLSVCGAALSLNGVLRGWAWYLPVLTTVFVVSLTMAALRAARAQPLLVTAGGFASLVAILTLTFFRSTGIAGIIPSGATLKELDRFVRRASETVLAESAPVAPNAGIVMVTCAVLGLTVILIDALALPLGTPATTGLGLFAILIVPAMVKPQSVGVWSFSATVAGYLLILACSQWFAPDAGTPADTARNPGQLKRAALIGSVALVATLIIPTAIPGFDQGTFPQGSRVNPWGTSTGLNPMITLGNSLRTPAGSGRITYATNAATPIYLRSVTVDNFDGDSWGPDDREASRQPVSGPIETGYEVPAEQLRYVTAVETGAFTSPYLPVPYAPESVRGLDGRWSFDPATLSIKGVDTNSRSQDYTVVSSTPRLTASLLDRSSAPVQGIVEDFIRVPGNVPDIVRTTADSVTGSGGSAYAKAMAIQRYLRSAEFTYSLQSPVQGGYDGNGLSVLADFLSQKSGYCIHYASAMAVMARLEGIPSRIAVGYAPGRLTGATVNVAGLGALSEYEVDARDAHAWPELYFQGLGWVPFEPTPSRGVVPDYATESSGSGSPGALDNNNDLIPSNDAAATPSPSAAPLPVPGSGPGSDPGSQSLPWLLGLAGSAALILLVSSPRLVRLGVRARRLRSTDPPSPAAIPLAWSELRDLGTDYGLAPGPSETPRTYSARLRSSHLLGEPGGMDDAAHQAVISLTADFERRAYGPPAGDSFLAGSGKPADRIAALQGSMRANVTRGRRLRAEWLPPSVMALWGRMLTAPFRFIGRQARRMAKAAARSWLRARDGLRRLGEG